MKQSRFLKDWRRRWVILTPQYLCSYRSPESTFQPPTEALRLADCSTVNHITLNYNRIKWYLHRALI